VFVEGVETYEAVQSPEQALQAGRAFGEFQYLLVDLPGERLCETIPFFHHTRRRFSALQNAIEKDHYNRVKDARAEIDFALKHEPIVDVILDAMAKGRIPERVTHNDTKFNNVMLDVLTGEAMCVVDLDTVMPGCALYDFGDMVRTTTSPTLEDETDLSKVKMQMPMFKKLAEGYLSTAGQFLTKAEKAHIAFSGKLITFEIGIRFLTDFLRATLISASIGPLTISIAVGRSLSWSSQSSDRKKRCRNTWTGFEARQRPGSVKASRLARLVFRQMRDAVQERQLGKFFAGHSPPQPG
jgi:hypothetical protein